MNNDTRNLTASMVLEFFYSLHPVQYSCRMKLIWLLAFQFNFVCLVLHSVPRSASSHLCPPTAEMHECSDDLHFYCNNGSRLLAPRLVTEQGNAHNDRAEELAQSLDEGQTIRTERN